jgi:hypothetical protein
MGRQLDPKAEGILLREWQNTVMATVFVLSVNPGISFRP